MSKQTTIAIVAGVTLLGFGAGMASIQGQKTPHYTGLVESIIVGNTEEYSTLLWVAQEQGYFADNGLTITHRDYASGKAAADALLAGEVDISTSAEFVVVSNSFDHADLRVLGTVDTVENLELIARRDRGIVEPGDLKGKKIGVTKKSVGEFFLGTFLTSNGLALNDVEVVNVAPKAMADTLSKGEVDAVLTWPPNVFAIRQKLGSNAISWTGQSGQRYNMVLVTTDQFVQEHVAAIERFLRALVMAEEFVEANNAGTKPFIAEKYKYDNDYINDAWPKHSFVVEVSQTLLMTMDDQARWRMRNNLSSNAAMPDYLNFIYTDALEVVNPAAVTLIR